jgi:methionyl aminopeptidase
MAIIIKSSNEIETMRQAGKIVTSVLKKLCQQIKVGMATRELDSIAARELKQYGATSSFKGYRGFPANLCVSLNNEIVHGIPNDRIIVEGDIISLDFGAFLDGFHSDAAITIGVGKISSKAERLIEACRGALIAGISVARPDRHLSDISATIQKHIESKGFSVVREYTGHGIGRDMHEDPQIPNFGPPGQGPKLNSGMTLAIEPMANLGSWKTKVNQDHWTVVTADNSLSAHFEKTIAITNSEAEILTPWDK